MKWPESLTLIRHGESEYNKNKIENKLFDPCQLEYSDETTPLTDEGKRQANVVGEKLKEIIKIPDVVIISPYLRTRETFDNLMLGWPELKNIVQFEDERIREQDHGLKLIYCNKDEFFKAFPEQEKLHKKTGEYYYRWPQGENVPDVRERLRSWVSTIVRDFHDQNVLVVTHHLTILGMRANLERLDADEFLRIDKEEKPINCGVTIYKGNPKLGKDGQGKLELVAYNSKLY